MSELGKPFSSHSSEKNSVLLSTLIETFKSTLRQEEGMWFNDRVQWWCNTCSTHIAESEGDCELLGQSTHFVIFFVIKIVNKYNLSMHFNFAAFIFQHNHYCCYVDDISSLLWIPCVVTLELLFRFTTIRFAWCFGSIEAWNIRGWGCEGANGWVKDLRFLLSVYIRLI